MKTKNLFLILILALILTFSVGSYNQTMRVFAQDVQQSQQAPTATTQPQVYIPAPDAAQTAPAPPPAPAKTFLGAIISMLQALFNVVLLIAAMVGIFILYKRMKSKNSTPEKTAEQRETPIDEPTTVTEAVASFVRHKIKRNL